MITGSHAGGRFTIHLANGMGAARRAPTIPGESRPLRSPAPPDLQRVHARPLLHENVACAFIERPSWRSASVCATEILASGQSLCNAVIIYGTNPVFEAVRAGHAREVRVSSRSTDRHQALITLARERGVPVGTMRSRTFYALKALRISMDEMGVTL